MSSRAALVPVNLNFLALLEGTLTQKLVQRMRSRVQNPWAYSLSLGVRFSTAVEALRVTVRLLRGMMALGSQPRFFPLSFVGSSRPLDRRGDVNPQKTNR